MGTNADKLVVTGIPNYDNAKQFLKNDFPFRDYVMVATTDMRETFRFENRPAFIKQSVKLLRAAHYYLSSTRTRNLTVPKTRSANMLLRDR
jgi:hypothetical protein